MINPDIFKYGSHYDIVDKDICKIDVKIIKDDPNHFCVYRYDTNNKLIDKYLITRELNACPYTIRFKKKQKYDFM